MNMVYRCVVLSFMVVTGTSAPFLKKLDMTLIESKAVVIEKMIQRDKYMALGLEGLAGLQQLVYWMPTLRYVCNISFGSPSCQGDVVEPKKMAFFAAISEAFQQLFFTQEGWHGLMQFSVGTAATQFILQKIDARFRHPDSLGWYMRAHVPYGKTMSVIKQVFKKLDAPDISDASREHAHRVLYASCNQLARYGEDICAYMTYKGTMLEEDQKIFAERVVGFLFNYHNDTLSQLHQALALNKPDYVLIRKLFAGYQSELRYQCTLFVALESSVDEDDELI